MCELQLVHSAMVLQRSAMVAHPAYAALRAAKELLNSAGPRGAGRAGGGARGGGARPASGHAAPAGLGKPNPQELRR